ncbi:MAG: HNH endonuclease signature motif containing protein [Gallionella sp.]|jgi:hypothetical protein
MQTKNCKTCGKKFLVFPFTQKTGRGKYCSKKCFYQNKEHKEHMSKIMIGRRLSKATREKISRVQRGKKLSVATRQKIKVANSGERSANWKGGRQTSTQGYVLRYCPTHPNRIKGNFVAEHRLIMEKHLGRTLLSTEIVHHINGNKKDNRIENLMLFASDSEHLKHHMKKDGHIRWRKKKQV